MYLLLIDFGLFILIWMVQLIIYPGLLYYQEKDLARWHDKYTSIMTSIVLPLMILQLILHAYNFIINKDLISGINFASVIAIWSVTFFISIPLHGNIANKEHVTASIEKLINTNWYRTILWTQIIVVDLLFHHKIIA